MLRAFLAGALGILCACGAGNVPRAGPEPARAHAAAERVDRTPLVFSTDTDGYGDRLPVGAQQRLGTARLAHRTEVAAIAWAHGDDVLVSADRAGEVRTWDGKTGRRLFRLPKARGTVIAVAPSGNTVAIAGDDLALYDLHHVSARWHIEGGGTRIRSLAFSPDGRRLAAGNGAAVDVLSAETGTPLAHFTGPQDRVARVAWSPGGQRIASADDDGVVLIRAATSGKLTATFHLAEGASPPQVLRFTPNGRWLLAGDEPIEVRDAHSGEFLHDLTGRGPIQGATLLHDGVTLLTSHQGPQHALVTWDVASGASRPAWTNGDTAPALLALDARGDRVAVADVLGRITLRDPADGTRLDEHVGHTGEVNAVVFSRDGRKAWSAGTDGEVFAWDVARGTAKALPDPHPGGALSLALSPDGEHLLTGGFDGVVRERDAANGWTVRTLHAGTPARVGYRRDGVPVTWSRQKGLIVWTQAGPRTLSPGSKGPMAIDTARRHALVPRDGRLVTVDLQSGATIGRPPPNEAPVASLQAAAWSPDGERIALAGGEGETWIVPAHGRGEVHVLHGPPGLVTAVAWSPDGTRLSSSHQDGARIWDASTDSLITRRAGHDNYVTDVIWTPDGSRIATASADGTILLWGAP